MSLRASGDAIRKFNVAYFTASCDTPEVNKKFAEKLKLDYPILSDPSRKVAEAYGVVTEKRRVPFRWTFFIGPDGKILHVDKKVNATKHGEHIAAQLKKLGVKEK